MRLQRPICEPGTPRRWNACANYSTETFSLHSGHCRNSKWEPSERACLVISSNTVFSPNFSHNTQKNSLRTQAEFSRRYSLFSWAPRLSVSAFKIFLSNVLRQCSSCLRSDLVFKVIRLVLPLRSSHTPATWTMKLHTKRSYVRVSIPQDFALDLHAFQRVRISVHRLLRTPIRLYACSNSRTAEFHGIWHYKHFKTCGTILS
jgi:hypothetical protein